MASAESRIALHQHLDSLRPDWEKNITVMEPVPHEPALLYHISKDPDIKEFIPQVSARTAVKEDKSIPRVCTAYTIWGCIKGYAAVVFDFNQEDDKTFRGGYQIYGLPYELCLRPSKRLLPDVDVTEERWLVGYDADHLQIKPERLGKFFLRTLTTTKVGKAKHLDVSLYLEVLPGYGSLRIHPELLLEAGYWKIEVVGMLHEWDWPESDAVTVTKISQSDYLAMKKSIASTLSFESVPVSARW